MFFDTFYNKINLGGDHRNTANSRRDAGSAWNCGAIEALRDAIRNQSEKTIVRRADALSSTVRSVITYWFMWLYCSAKLAVFVSTVNAGADWSVTVDSGDAFYQCGHEVRSVNRHRHTLEVV